MIRVLLLSFLAAAPAKAFELSLEGGPASVAGEGTGVLSRLGIAAGAGGSGQAQLALQLLSWSGAEDARGRAALSFRWQRTFAASTVAVPMVLVGLDLGVDAFEFDELAVSGHFGAGVRVPLGRRLFAPLLLVATVGGGPPALAATVGVGASFD